MKEVHLLKGLFVRVRQRKNMSRFFEDRISYQADWTWGKVEFVFCEKPIALSAMGEIFFFCCEGWNIMKNIAKGTTDPGVDCFDQ